MENFRELGIAQAKVFTLKALGHKLDTQKPGKENPGTVAPTLNPTTRNEDIGRYMGLGNLPDLPNQLAQ